MSENMAEFSFTVCGFAGCEWMWSELEDLQNGWHAVFLNWQWLYKEIGLLKHKV